MLKLYSTLLLILTSLFSLAVFAEDKLPSRSELNKKNDADAKTYLSKLSSDQQSKILEMYSRIDASNDSLTQINSSTDTTRPVVLLIQGVFLNKPEWYEPFDYILKNNFTTYFVKFPRFTSLKANVDRVSLAAKQILTNHPEQHVIAFAYCAGGSVALLSLQNLAKELSSQDLARFQLHTTASPVAGYGSVPKGKKAYVASIVMGASTVAVGQGIQKFVTSTIPQCRQWITTNPALDYHARKDKDRYPQIITPAPCGEHNVIKIHDETHRTILIRAMKEVLHNQ